MNEWMAVIHAAILILGGITAIYSFRSHGRIKKITIELNGKEDHEEKKPD